MEQIVAMLKQPDLGLPVAKLTLEARSGFDRATLQKTAAVYARSGSAIAVYGIGLTQHREVRLIAAVATRHRPPATRDLGRVSHQRWSELRHRLEQRRHARTLRTRFRRDPHVYLAELEQAARQLEQFEVARNRPF